FFLYIVFEYNKIHFSNVLNRNIVLITLFFSLITLIRTGLALIQNPQVSRSLKATGEYSEALYRSGIGGYEFIYFLVIMVPILMLLCSNNLPIRKSKIILVF